MLVSLVIFIGIAVLAGKLGGWLNTSPRAQVYLNQITRVVFVGLALKLLTASAHIE